METHAGLLPRGLEEANGFFAMHQTPKIFKRKPTLVANKKTIVLSQENGGAAAAGLISFSAHKVFP